VSLEAVYQHPRELVLALFDGPPRFEMTVLASADVRVGVVDVSVNIIGESHALVCSRDGVPFFSEVLACTPEAERDSNYHYAFTRMDNHAVGDGAYRGRVGFREANWEIPVVPPENMLQVTFPQTHGHIPLTRVMWAVQGVGLRWWTLHTYPLPTEQISVYSTSTFDFATEQGEIAG
jgi:hypothetical protein